MNLAKRKQMNPLIPLASMGDIAFLLIIFFMITSNFIKEKNIQLKHAVSADVEKLKESQISVCIDKDGKLWLQGRACETGVLENEVRSLAENRPDKIVMLKVDKDITHEKYAEVLLALSKAEVEIALAGERRKAKGRR